MVVEDCGWWWKIVGGGNRCGVLWDEALSPFLIMSDMHCMV